MPAKHRIAVVPGDGIGHEIVPAALDVLNAALEPTESELETTEFPFGAGHYRSHGMFMPSDGLDILRPFDAILFGAVGLPEVEVGDLFALLDTGAYQEVSASNFNAMPRPA